MYTSKCILNNVLFKKFLLLFQIQFKHEASVYTFYIRYLFLTMIQVYFQSNGKKTCTFLKNLKFFVEKFSMAIPLIFLPDRWYICGWNLLLVYGERNRFAFAQTFSTNMAAIACVQNLRNVNKLLPCFRVSTSISITMFWLIDALPKFSKFLSCFIWTG